METTYFPWTKEAKLGPKFCSSGQAAYFSPQKPVVMKREKVQHTFVCSFQCIKHRQTFKLLLLSGLSECFSKQRCFCMTFAHVCCPWFGFTSENNKFQITPIPLTGRQGCTKGCAKPGKYQNVSPSGRFAPCPDASPTKNYERRRRRTEGENDVVFAVIRNF